MATIEASSAATPSHSGTASSLTATAAPQSPSNGASISSGASKGNNTPVLLADNMQALTCTGHNKASSISDIHVPRQGSLEQAKRYRRKRSLGGLNANAQVANVVLTTPSSSIAVGSTKRPSHKVKQPSSLSRQGSRASSSQSREQQDNAGSVSSSASTRLPSSWQESSTRRTSAMSPSSPLKTTPAPVRRIIATLPLPNYVSPDKPPRPVKKAIETFPNPAMQEFTALHGERSGSSTKSRLRRDFSFRSAAELTEPQKDKYQSEQGAERASAFTKPGAASMGAGIYSAKGGFTGLTDNLSISVASSASIMIRKMGNKLKNGNSSIKRLFRPKSVNGIPAADGLIAQPTGSQVLMVSADAGRQRLNANADPRDQVGGGICYARLARSSLHARQTAAKLGRSHALAANESWPRKTVVGGFRERAEAYSSTKQGILKRTGAGSIQLPNDDRARPVDINGEDCFGRAPRILIPRMRSQNTPHEALKNVTFSSRIQFYDVWSSSDYDRRGDITTCSRLTPMLAQQIKVELNSFKMEMEVHKLSKSHTSLL